MILSSILMVNHNLIVKFVLALSETGSLGGVRCLCGGVSGWCPWGGGAGGQGVV